MTTLDFQEIEDQLGLNYARDLLTHLCNEYEIPLEHTSIDEHGETLTVYPHKGNTSLQIYQDNGSWVASLRDIGQEREEYTARNVHRVALKGFSGLVFYIAMRTASVYLTEKVKRGEQP